jgi:Carboxypeptidase regulatory-like domain
MRVDPRPLRIQLVLLAVLIIGLAAVAYSQTTISTGSIVGTVMDPSGAVVSGAKVSIVSRGTGRTIATTSNSTGAFNSGALVPDNYSVRVEAAGFRTAEIPVTVQVNSTSTVNAKLSVGQSSQVMEVQGADVAVNTEQATVQGVLTTDQIENLPINGRNFMDLAQLEPGVQIQDGGTFDPTKNGFSSISFGGRFGRTARIEVDGVDVSDETVGTTTQNLPLGAIQESSLQQSSLDLSTELTSSGSVNLTTKSGTNSYHGEGFYYFRDQRMNAALPGGSTNPFQRNQFGGSFGGPIIKNQLFFFLDAERNKQDFVDPVLPGGPFTSLTGNFTSPFRENQVIGRLDYQIGNTGRAFYRFTFDQNRSVLPYIPNSFQPFANVNHARDHVVGLDFNTGSFTHSVRFGYTKFQNGITDAVAGSSIFNPAPGIELAIGSDPNCLTAGADVFCSGPNFLAPQATVQSNHQIKYDGSKPLRNHIFRYGVGYNHIQGGGFAKFLGLGAAVGANNATPPCVTAGNCPFPNLAANPLNYPVTNVNMGNGQGFATLHPSFGFPAGGLGPDDRLSWYIGDSWKIKPNFTLTMGLRYVRDTGRTDSEFGPLPVAEQFGPGLGKQVRQPNRNFAPQLGIAWDPRSNGKTVIRAGIGLFYENSIWNNNLFDPPAREPQGLFLATQPACENGAPPVGGITLPGGAVVNPTFCGQPVGSVFQDIVALQNQYQAATIAAGPAVNPVYLGNILADGIDVTGTNLFDPNYRTPRSLQINVGVQREIRAGMVFTVDYLRNVATHNMLTVDTNHIGDARFFNRGAAVAAINTTLANCGVATVGQAIASCPNDPTGSGDPSYTARPATISDFALNGLDSGYSLCGGVACPTAAFAGINPNLGTNQMLSPIGRSVYNGLQASLKQNVRNPVRGINYLNLEVSYSFSRYVSTARDNDFINFATDNNQPTRYIGPNGLDRTHQLSFGGFFDVPGNFRFSIISHFLSPLAGDVTVPVTGGAGGIFVSDVTGDGTGDGTFASNGGLGDPLPGTNIGGFGRSFGVSGLNRLITNYNSTMAGQATPAGQQLISSGLLTLAQLQALGAVMQPIATAPAGAIGQSWLRALDFGVSWGYKIKERVELRPGVTFFNVFNFANFDGPAAPFSTVLDGSQGSPNGTTSPQPSNLRLGLGSGVFAVGAPRVVEFQMKLTF